MIQLDTGQLLTAAQQIEITKLSVVSMLVSIMLMFTVTVFALVVFGRKSSRHAAEREKLNTNWQATMKDVARQLTEEFTPLVNTIGRVVLAVGELQRDITGSVDGLSSNVSSVTSQVGELVQAVTRMSALMEASDVARRQRDEELFSRDTDTASRIDKIELALGGVRSSIDALGQKVIGSVRLPAADREAIRQLIDTARSLLEKYGVQIEAMKEEQHEHELESDGNDITTAGGADAAGADAGGGAGAGDLADAHGGSPASGNAG